jgi:hypothetical protein
MRNDGDDPSMSCNEDQKLSVRRCGRTLFDDHYSLTSDHKDAVEQIASTQHNRGSDQPDRNGNNRHGISPIVHSCRTGNVNEQACAPVPVSVNCPLRSVNAEASHQERPRRSALRN